jgi:hypothetical protein
MMGRQINIEIDQLGRRNLTPDQMSVIRGRQDGGHGDQKSEYQNDTPNAAEALAREHGVSPATIKRDGKKAELLDALPQQTISEVIDGKKVAA